MVTGVAGGSAVVTITATDPDGLSAAHGVNINVTEEEAETNSAPVAVGSIPAHELEVGGTATITTTGFFTDPDGDDLAYSVSSSNTAVADASAEGAEVMITGVAGGSAVITITATDPEGLSAAHGVNVTVTEEETETNSPPVAVGSIPAHELEAGGTATITATGFFTDPDGDDLAYSVSSSNTAVADASADGAEVMITGVASGAAVVTITATDPDGLAAAHGVNVTVTQMEAAEIEIVGLRAPGSNDYLDAAMVMGEVEVVLAVEENDEDVDDISLAIMPDDGEAMMVDACTPAAQGMATCRVNTAMAMDPVAGDMMCHGRQMMPSYPNGDYTIMASAMTDDGMTRESDALGATFMNSEYAMLVHKKGNSVSSNNKVWYGGPDAVDEDGNLTDMSTADAFKVCPVYFDGTMIDSVTLSSPGATLKKGPDFDYWLLEGGRNNFRIQGPITAMLTQVMDSDGEWTVVDGMDSPLYASAMANFDFMAPVGGWEDWITFHVDDVRAGLPSADRADLGRRNRGSTDIGGTFGASSGFRWSTVLRWSATFSDAGTGLTTAGAPIAVMAGVETMDAQGRVSCAMDDDAEPMMGNGNGDRGIRLTSIGDGHCYTAKGYSVPDKLGNVTENVSYGRQRMSTTVSQYFNVDVTAPEVTTPATAWYQMESVKMNPVVGYIGASDGMGSGVGMPSATPCDATGPRYPCGAGSPYEIGGGYSVGNKTIRGYPVTFSWREGGPNQGMWAYNIAVPDMASPTNTAYTRAIFGVDGEDPIVSNHTTLPPMQSFVQTATMSLNASITDRHSGLEDARLFVFSRLANIDTKTGDIRLPTAEQSCSALVMGAYEAKNLGPGGRIVDSRRVLDSGMAKAASLPPAGLNIGGNLWEYPLTTSDDGRMASATVSLDVVRPTSRNEAKYDATRGHYGNYTHEGTTYTDVALEDFCFFVFAEDASTSTPMVRPPSNGFRAFKLLGSSTVLWSGS